MTGKRIAILSPCGWGNLGDAAIIDTVIQQFKSNIKDVSFIGLTLNPTDTEKRHHIDAMSIRGFTQKNYAVSLTGPEGTDLLGKKDIGNPTAPQQAHTQRSGHRRTSYLRQRLKRVPYAVKLVRKLRNVRTGLTAICDEIRHLRKSFRLLGRVDMVIIAGGGQLDDFWGGAWGHPYVLFRWATLAKLTATDFVVLSAGVGQLTSTLSRYFVRKALDFADYRSYRDQGSKDMLRFAKVSRSDPVIPDLAFAYRVLQDHVSPSAGSIGISPMIYKGPTDWPTADVSFFNQYVGALSGLICRLVKSGYRVTLFPSVRSDTTAIDEVLRALDVHTREAILCPEVTTVEDLMRTLSSVDLTIASRLHGVLLSYVAQRPVIALSYERKVDTLMREFGNEKFCFSIDAISVTEIHDAIEEIGNNKCRLQRRNEVTVSRSSEAVRRQLDEMIGRLRSREAA